MAGLSRTLAAIKQRQAGTRPAGGPGAEGAGRPGLGSGSGSAGASSKTKFHELLVDGWESRNGREAFLEELRLQVGARGGHVRQCALAPLSRCRMRIERERAAVHPAGRLSV